MHLLIKEYSQSDSETELIIKGERESFVVNISDVELDSGFSNNRLQYLTCSDKYIYIVHVWPGYWLYSL